MITGELKGRIDRIWDAFWSGGISNPLEVIEQITYLLFIRRLDDIHTLAESRANRFRKPIENPVFQVGQDNLRWSRFKDFEPAVMHQIVGEGVFPFLRGLGGDGSTYSHHMKDARYTIPTPALLSRVVDMLDEVPMTDRDTNGDRWDGGLGGACTNGQFRTPRHIIKLMVEMTAPGPEDEICDPACGTAGFLVEAGEYATVSRSSRTHHRSQRSPRLVHPGALHLPPRGAGRGRRTARPQLGRVRPSRTAGGVTLAGGVSPGPQRRRHSSDGIRIHNAM